MYDRFLEHPSVETDTRKLKTGDIFFALKGPSFNGNLFARQALDLGASYVVVDENPGFTDDRIIRTENVLESLQALAGHHRRQFNIPFIAITGSKTGGSSHQEPPMHYIQSLKMNISPVCSENTAWSRPPNCFMQIMQHRNKRSFCGRSS